MEHRSSGEDFSKHVTINDYGTKELCLDERQLSDWPEGITNQTHLEGLHLRDNYFTELPENINKLKNLKILKVDGNKLKQLPDSICELTELKELSVNNNQLSCLPTEILELTKLEKLNLSANNLTNLPDNIGHLKELCVSYNQLSTVPTSSTQHFTKLERLYISGNKFRYLPDNIGDFKNLREFNVSHNQLSSVPNSIQQLTELEKLDLGENELETLPDSISGLKELRELNVYTNKLSTVPTSIHLLTKLQRLNLHGNRLTSFPESICELKELRELSVDSNQLPILPYCIQQLTKLQRLNLDGNMLKELPDSIGALLELKELSINRNQLSVVPDSIQHLIKLQRLHLDGNRLKELPESIGGLMELEELSLRKNQLSLVPDSIQQLTKLQRLNLDGNKLKGLPDSIGNLMELKKLSVNSNQLSTVPYSIQKLKKIEVLFLAFNRLTEITLDISDKKGLTKLHVRGNPLTFDEVKRLLVLKLDRPDIGIDIDVPAEIESQGEKAQCAYIKALGDGFVEVYRGRILIVGQDGAGKTCLKNSLLGLPFDPNERSTEGIEVDPSKCEIDVEKGVKNWQSTGKNEQLLGCSEDIAKIVIEKLPHEKDFRAIDCLLVEDKKKIDEEELESNEDVEMEEDKGDFHTSQEAEPNVVGATDYTFAQPELNVDATSLPDEIKSHTNQLIKELRCEFTEKEQSVISMDLWDFAGQHVYYATHPAFFSLRAIYLMVHNLNKPLNKTAEPYYRQGYYDVKLENPHGETNLENLQSWLATLHNITQMKGEDKSDTVQRKPGYLRPPVLIVGTHADEPAENIPNIKLQIQRRIATKEYVKHVVQPMFSINNDTRRSPQHDYKIDTIEALRNKIMTVWNQEPYMGEKIPVRWISFEKVINALVAEDIYHQSLKQLRCYASFIKDDQEFDTMMQFYHDLGIIVKHRETVILDAQWLINLFRQLITIPHYENADSSVTREWQNLEKNGVLSSELIDHVFRKWVLDGVVKKDILHLMEQFGLIAKFELSPTNVKYFVPAQLKAPPDNLYAEEPTESDPCPLYLLFVGDFVPHGLFTQLVARSIYWCSKFGATQIPRLYLNGAWFVIGSREFSHSFYLFCKKRFIKIVLIQRTKRDQNKSSQVATKVRQFVVETLQGLSQDFPYLKGLQYHFGVECPPCQQRKGKCEEHSQEPCEDCLHLLEIEQGMPLSCENDRDEELEVPGLEKWCFEVTIPELHEDIISRENQSGEDISMSTTPKRVLQEPPNPNAKRMKSEDKVKEGLVSEYELEGLSKELENWKPLARRLGFEEAELNRFGKMDEPFPEKAFAMLRTWKQKEGSDASYKVLYDALCHEYVNLRQLAQRFCCNK